MITVRNRTLIVPEGERVIGTDYDSNSEVRQFRVEKAPGGIDISHLVFRLDLMYQGETYDTCKLEKEEHGDCMILTWTVAVGNVSHPGTVWISLRAIDEAGSVKWGSNKAAVYVQASVNTPGNISGMAELEEYEKKVEESLQKSAEALSAANEATIRAEEAVGTAEKAATEASGSAENAEDFADFAEAWAHGKDGYQEQEENNSKYWSDLAKGNAETATKQAEIAKNYAESVAPLTDRGEYSAEETYQKNDLVRYQNAIWRCKEDSTGSAPKEGDAWALFFRGVQSVSELVAADTQKLLSEQDGQQVNAQELLDAIADKVATKLLLKTDVVSQLVNDATKAASAAAVYALQQKLGVGDLPAGMTDVVGGISSLYSNLGQIRETYLSTPITPISGQTYTIGSLALETGKWILFGATLAGGDLIIDGDIICHCNGRNANTTYEISTNVFAVSHGGTVNLKLLSNGFGTIHADKNYCSLIAIRIN